MGQVEANRAKLPVALAQLPGGGLAQGVTAFIEDQVQEFNVLVEILHKVRAHMVHHHLDLPRKRESCIFLVSITGNKQVLGMLERFER